MRAPQRNARYATKATQTNDSIQHQQISNETMSNTKTKFDPKSAGFIGSILSVILAAFAASGVQFPSDPDHRSGRL
jgi:hypothetical protein